MPLPEYHENDDPIGDISTVGEYWRWAMSDLLGNRNRGIFAEFLVAKALGQKALEHPRIEWDCYDVEYRNYRIEVKSSAYIQTWNPGNGYRSKPSFTVNPSDRCWDARYDEIIRERKRYANLYVFCIFPATPDQNTRNVLDLENWRFYPITTGELEKYIQPETKTIGIAKVKRICGDALKHHDLKAKIDILLNTL